MKEIKKFKVYKMLPFILASSIALSGCSKNDRETAPLSEIMQVPDVKDLTLIDELMESGMILKIDNQDIIEAADRLKKYMNIVDEVKEIDFSEIDSLKPLPEEDIQKIMGYSVEEVRVLKSIVNGKPQSMKGMEDKVSAYKKLYYLKTHCQEWINENGYNTSLALLMTSVKAALADELGISADKYHTIAIASAKRSNKDEPSDYVITVGEDEWDQEKYIVPSSESRIWNAINDVYELQSVGISKGKENETYRKIIEEAATVITTGIDIIKKNDKNRIVSENSKKASERFKTL